MNNKKTGIALSYGYTVVNMIANLFLSSFLLRSLGDFEYGLYQTVSAFVNFLVILEFGTGTVMCRNIILAKKSNDSDKIKNITSTMFYITNALAVLIFVCGLIFEFSIPFVYSNNIPADRMMYAQIIFAVMLLRLIVSFFYQTFRGLYLGNENYNIGNILNLIALGMNLLLVVLLLSFFKNSLLIAVISLFISIFQLVFTVIYTKRKYIVSFSLKYFSKDILKESLPLCVALLLQAIVVQANNNVDKMVISIKLSMESVSLYSVAMYIYNMFSGITTIPIGMYMPQISKNINDGKIEKGLYTVLISSARLNTVVGGTIVFGFIAVGKQFINIVYGAQYEQAWIYAVIVLIPMFLNMVNGCMVNVLDILNKRQFRSYILMFSTFINIVLTVILIDIYGIIGALIGTVISILLGQLVLINIYYCKIIKVNVFKIYFAAFKNLIPAQMAALAVGWAVGAFIQNQILSFLAGGCSFVIVELIAMMMFGFNKSEKDMIKKMLLKVKALVKKKGVL